MTLSLAPHGVDAHLPEALDVRRDEAPLEAALGGPAPVEHRHLDEAELLPERPGVDGEEVEVGSAGAAGVIHEAACDVAAEAAAAQAVVDNDAAQDRGVLIYFEAAGGDDAPVPLGDEEGIDELGDEARGQVGGGEERLDGGHVVDLSWANRDAERREAGGGLGRLAHVSSHFSS